MSSYEARRKIAEENARRNSADIKRLVDETKELYSIVRSIESQVTRINSLMTMLMLSTLTTPGGAAKLIPGMNVSEMSMEQITDVVVRSRVGLPIPSALTAPSVPGVTPSALPMEVSAMMKLTIITAIIPIIFQISNMIATEIARREALRILKEAEAEMREEFQKILNAAEKDTYYEFGGVGD